MQRPTAIFVAVLVFILAGPAFGATYYLNCDATANGAGTSADPFNSLTSAKTAAGNNDTVNVAGACSGVALDDTNTGQTWQVWVPFQRPTITKTTGIVLDPATNSTYSGIIFDGGEQTNYDVVSPSTASTGWKVDGCDIVRGRRGVVQSRAGGSGTITRSHIYGQTGNANSANSVAAGTLILTFNRIGGFRYSATLPPRQLYLEGGTTYAYNNDFYGAYRHSVVIDKAAVTRTDIINNTFFGYGSLTSSVGYAIMALNTGSPTLNVSNNYLTSNGRIRTDFTGLSGVTCTNCITNTPLEITAAPAPGKFLLAIDDFDNSADADGYYTDAVPLITGRGVPVTHFIDLDGSVDWTEINNLCTSGNGLYKVGNHSYHHVNLAAANTPYAFTFSTYPAGARFSFDGTQYFKLYNSSDAELASFDVSAAAYDTLPELIAGINAVSGFSGAATHTNIGTRSVRSNSIKTYASTAISTLTTNRVELDYGAVNSRWYYNEITRARLVIEANVPASCISKTFAYPGGGADATVRSWIQNNEAATIQTAWVTDSGTTDPRVGNVDLYNLYRYAALSQLKGATEADTNARSAALCAGIAAGKQIAAMYAHSRSELSLNEWAGLIDACKAFGVTPATADEINTFLTDTTVFTGSDADSDGSGTKEAWTLAGLLPEVATFGLRAASPARDTGTNTPWSGTANIVDYSGNVKITDGSGNIIAPGGTVDIGAYEYRSRLITGNGFFGN